MGLLAGFGGTQGYCSFRPAAGAASSGAVKKIVKDK
jgi:hypothetical protein